MNYIKSVWTLAGILIAAAMGTGCSDNTTNSLNEQESLCVDSGGQYNHDRCECSGTVCDENVVCGADKTCAGTATEPLASEFEQKCTKSGGTFKDNRCECSGAVCDENVVCGADKTCAGTAPEPPASEFEQKCTKSGGTYKDNRCECSGAVCGENVVCGADKTCAGTAPEPPASEFEQKCTKSGGTYKDNRCICSGETCDANTVCGEDGKCPGAIKPDCNPGDKKCTGSTTYECVEDLGWTVVEKCEKACADDGKKCAQCFETSCKDGILTQCNDNIATTITCEHGCNDTANDCKPECEAGQVKCDGQARLECNPDTLTWRSVEKCDVTCELETEGKTRCIDDCEAGATRCHDGKISTCIDQIWGQPVACEFNGVCQNAEKCVECTIDDPANPPKRCFNDVNGVAHIQICNGKTYEDELIPEDSSNPDSKKIPNVSADGYSCKEHEIAFGNCNNLAGAFCENRINADNQGHDLGIMYTCKDGMKVEDKKCWDPEDYTTKVSCNADKTGCGECINNMSNACKNGSDGVGIVTKCIDGEYQDVSCERGLACRDDGKNCKSCRYNANIRDNEMLCMSNNRVQIMVCSENGSWEPPKECKPDLNVDKYDKQCRKGTSDYHDYCPGGY